MSLFKSPEDLVNFFTERNSTPYHFIEDGLEKPINFVPSVSRKIQVNWVCNICNTVSTGSYRTLTLRKLNKAMCTKCNHESCTSDIPIIVEELKNMNWCIVHVNDSDKTKDCSLDPSNKFVRIHMPKNSIAAKCNICKTLNVIDIVTWKTKKLCQVCDKKPDIVRHTIEEIREAFQNKKFELLSTKYENNKARLRYKCHCGKETTITYANFLRNEVGCNDCRIKSRCISWNDVKAEFENDKCILISTEQDYKNQDSPLHYVCNCGKDSIITWKKFQRGTRCNNCLQTRRAKNSHTTKTFTFPSGKIVTIQGFEHFAIAELLDKGIAEDDICVDDNRPVIPYIFDGKTLNYEPDIFIKSKNILIEVKSTYTLDIQSSKNDAKFMAAGAMYNLFVWVYGGKNNTKLEILNYCKEGSVDDIDTWLGYNINKKFKIDPSVTVANNDKSGTIGELSYEQRLEGYNKFQEVVRSFGGEMISLPEDYFNITSKLRVMTPEGEKLMTMKNAREQKYKKGVNTKIDYKNKTFISDIASKKGLIVNFSNIRFIKYSTHIQYICMKCDYHGSIMNSALLLKPEAGCKKCMVKNRRLDWDVVRKPYIENNCTLLTTSDEYKNNEHRLSFQCFCGNEAKMTWRRFKEIKSCGCTSYPR